MTSSTPSTASPRAEPAPAIGRDHPTANSQPDWPSPLFLLALLALFSIAWLWHLSAVALVPPLDNVEQLVWAQTLQWGYHKHPPLPTWILAAFAAATGLQTWATYLLGAATTLGAVLLFAAVLREVHGPRFAALGVLAGLCITFYNGRLYYYNHNTVLMLWVAASAWLWLRVLASGGRLAWWLALGAVGALGLLSKYQYAVTLLALGGLYGAHGLWRDAAHRRGLLAAVAVGSALMAPHLLWLLHAPTSPIHYAMRTSLNVGIPWAERLPFTLNWLADWLLNRCLPAWAMLAGAAWLLRRRAALPTAPAASPTADAAPLPVATRAGRHLLVAFGLVPLLFMTAIGLGWGVALQKQWGTAFALWTVPWVMQAVGLAEARLALLRWRPVLGQWLVLQALLMLQSHQTSAYGRFPTTPPHWRQFPAAAIAAEVGPKARAELGGPITIVSGITHLAGAVAMHLPEHPKVLIDGQLAISPWLTEAELAQGRVLELFAPGQGPPEAHTTLGGWRWRTRPGVAHAFPAAQGAGARNTQ